VQRFKADVVDFVATPTYAATWYEARLTRTPGSPLPLPTAGLLTQGQVAGAVVMLDETGAVEGYADPFAIAVEPVFAGGRTLHDIPMPGPAEGAVRVMSYNVERNTPLSKPESFRRLIAATRPDVLLLQEWDAGDAAAMAAWFSQIDGGEWHVAKAAGSLGDGGGVAIVSRFPLTPLPGGLTTHESSGSRPVRFVGAVVVTPAGEMLVASAHLKCCGSAGTSEDQRRLAEAGAINMMLRATAAAYPGAVRIVGGDLNLVGSRPPLDVLRAGLDADDSDLAVAVPVTWGDCTLTTWRDPGTDFPPGRLDYVLYSDANCEVTGAYVLDTGNLSESARAAMGLQAGDGAEADHLPVFIDVKRR
jgi:endonuclease/exonuclease/phosphatase family metal-dependent hydrolase